MPSIELQGYEDLMDTDTKPTQPSDSAKKPYQAPELVVMGEAAEMTQNITGPGADGGIFATDAGS